MQVVTAAVIKDNDKYLITQRASNDKLAFKWEFPGGKVEAGETPEECLKREIKEELNLEIEVGERISTSIYNYDSGSIKLVAYYAHIAGGSVKLSIHNDAKWVTANELRQFDFCPADLNVVEKLMVVKNSKGCIDEQFN